MKKKILNYKLFIVAFICLFCHNDLSAQTYFLGDLLVYNGDFKTNDLTGWTSTLISGVTISASTGSAVFKGKNTPAASQTVLKRIIAHLPDGTYILSADFKYSGTGSTMKFLATTSSGTLTTTVVSSSAFASATVNAVTVVNGALTIALNYINTSTTSTVTVDNIRLKRTARPNPTKMLPFVGVAPYARMDQVFYGLDSTTPHSNFLELAKTGGANTIRTHYYSDSSDNSAWFPMAQQTKDLGLKHICTIIPKHTYATYAASITGMQADFTNAVTTILNAGIVPDIIMIGNEVNTNAWELTNFASWNYTDGTTYAYRSAKTLAAAARGIRAAGFTGDIGTHIDRSWVGFFTDDIAQCYTDIQVAAFSCYPKHGDDNTTVEQKVANMYTAASTLNLKVLVIETGAPYVGNEPYTTQDFDADEVTEVSLAGQANHIRKMCDLVLNIPNNKGIGVITWGSDMARGIHAWADVTWNRAQVTSGLAALPGLFVFNEYNSSPGTPVVIIKSALTTTVITGATEYTKHSGGKIFSDGGAPVTARGICWSLSPYPTIANDTTKDGNGTGTFSSSFSGLISDTLYYVRAYAINSAGVSYGNQVTVSTQGPNLLLNASLLDDVNHWDQSGTPALFKLQDWSPDQPALKSWANNYWQWTYAINGSVTQTVSNLQNGKYIFSGKFIGNTAAGANAVISLIATDGNGIVTSKVFPMPLDWTKIEMPVIVTGGQCSVGFNIADGANSTFWFGGADFNFRFLKLNQTITLDSIHNKYVADADFIPGAVSNSGLAIGFISSNPAVATIINGNVHIVGTGTAIIKAIQTGDALYNPAIPVTRTFTVLPCVASSILSGPVSQSKCPGSAVQFSVTASNDLSYQWQVNKGNGFENINNGSLYQGTSTAQLSVMAVNTTLNGYTYRVIVNGPCASTVASTAASLEVAAAPAILSSGATTFCQGEIRTLSATPGFASYVWSTGATTASIDVSVAGTYSVTATNASGCTIMSDITTVIVNPLPVAPVINGKVNICANIGTGEELTYTAAATGATGYTWILPANVTLISGAGTATIVIKLENGFSQQANKQLKVTAGFTCGTSTQAIFYLAAQYPSTPNPISGNTNVCALIGTAATASYQVKSSLGAASYLWALPTGATAVHTNPAGVNDTIIQVAFSNSFAGGTINVSAINNCGTSGMRSINIPRMPASTPGLINGPTNVCANILPGGHAAIYTIVPASGVSSYIWTAPAGSIVEHTNGTGMNDFSVTVLYPQGFTGGSITVGAINGCGSSGIRSLAISKLNPATPGIIDVIQTADCASGGRIYSYALSTMPSGALNVQWTIPASPGAVLLSGQGTTSINVAYPANAISGNITALAFSNCGSSSIRNSVVRLPACAQSFTANNKNISTHKTPAVTK